MPSLSLAGGIDASYAVAAGKTFVTISSGSHLNHRAAYVGTGQMLLHWVQEGKTEVWRCDTSMVDPVAVSVVEKFGADGRQELEVEMGAMYPAGLLLQGRMVGALLAPAIHVDVPLGADVWVFLIRSPWFPLNLQVDRSNLTVEHGGDRVTGNLSTLSEGGVAAQVQMTGTGFKNASISIRRTLCPHTSEELVCDVGSGVQAAAWKPILRSFDLVLVTRGNVSESQFASVARGLGAEVSSGIFGTGGVQGDYILCDGPAFSYAWVLKGHRGFLENEEDRVGAKFTW
jgi:hypothetical protein